MTAERTVLITGTSSGIGLAAAVGAARAGLRVVATMRDTGKEGPLRRPRPRRRSSTVSP